MERGEQFSLLTRLLACDQRDLAALQRVVGQGDGTGGADAFDLEPADAVAQFGRERQRDLNLGRLRGEGGIGAGKHPFHTGGVKAVGEQRDVLGRPTGRADGGQRDLPFFEGRGAEAEDRAAGLVDGDVSVVFERGQQRFAFGAVEAVGHPEGLERALDGFGPGNDVVRCRWIGGRFERRKPWLPRFGGLEGDLLRRIGRQSDGDRAGTTTSVVQEG